MRKTYLLFLIIFLSFLIGLAGWGSKVSADYSCPIYSAGYCNTNIGGQGCVVGYGVTSGSITCPDCGSGYINGCASQPSNFCRDGSNINYGLLCKINADCTSGNTCQISGNWCGGDPSTRSCSSDIDCSSYSGSNSFCAGGGYCSFGFGALNDCGGGGGGCQCNSTGGGGGVNNGACSPTHYGCNLGTSVSNVEGTSAWTWTCNGSSGGTNASCSESIPTPTNFTSSCLSPGTTANLSWILPSGYTLSYFRVVDNITGAHPSAWIPENVSDTGPTTSFTTTPGHNYTAWVQTRLPSGSYSSEVYSSFTCTAAIMSGTLTASPSSCTIASGASSCNVNLTWTTTNPQGISAVTAVGMANVNGNSGSQSFAVPYSSRIFYLYNNAQLLAQNFATATCISGTAWNGSICTSATTTMSGTLTPAFPSCAIASGASSCNINLTWTTTNPQGTSAVTATGMANVNGNSGSQSFAVPYSSRIFNLYNNAQLLAQSPATATCILGTTWNGSICTSAATACSGGVDIGLRIYQSGSVYKVATEAGSPTSPIRIYKDGIHGILLIDPSDPNASKIHIQTSSGIKAYCLLP